MAEAQKRTKLVREISFVERNVVELTLSEEEATILLDICNNIEGHLVETRRGLSDNIGRALRKAGVKGYLERGEPNSDFRGSIYFQ